MPSRYELTIEKARQLDDLAFEIGTANAADVTPQVVTKFLDEIVSQFSSKR